MGPAWHKSGIKRVGSLAHQQSTPDLIGPGIILSSKKYNQL